MDTVWLHGILAPSTQFNQDSPSDKHPWRYTLGNRWLKLCQGVKVKKEEELSWFGGGGGGLTRECHVGSWVGSAKRKGTDGETAGCHQVYEVNFLMGVTGLRPRKMSTLGEAP